MPEITVFNLPNPQETKTFEITPQTRTNQECFIGRDDRCCVVLSDIKISRIHGKISFREGTYYYSDLGSRNGSQINNQRVKANQNYPLKFSDTITLSNYLIWFKAISKKSTSEDVNQQKSPALSHPPKSQPDLSLVTKFTQKAGKLRVTCVQMIRETPNTKTFRFVTDDPQLFNYQPGQFVTVDVNVGGKPVKSCCYPISSTPSRPHTLDLTIKLNPFLGEDSSPVAHIKKFPKSSEIPKTIAGLVNNWLYKKVKIGSKLTISQPMGKVNHLLNPTKKLLLISAGIGITSMISIARWLGDTVSDVDTTFVHSARNPQDLIFLKELELMAQRNPNLKLAITVTRPEKATSWYGYTGRINDSMINAISPDYLSRNVYVAGSESFRQSMKSLMQTLSLPMNNYYEESLDISQTLQPYFPQVTSMAKVKPVTSQAQSLGIFAKASQNLNSSNIKTKSVISAVYSSKVSSAAVATIASSEPIKTKLPIVLFNQSEKEITCDREKSILDQALAEGIDLPYGCGIGICGQCKLKKNSGKVVYDDDDISCEDSHVLTCIAKAEGKVVIEG